MIHNDSPILTSQQSNYTLYVFNSKETCNPREDMDTFGTMVCWHRRYNLGDKHHYSEPEVFLRELLFSSFCSAPKTLYNYLSSGCSNHASIKYNASTRETELYEKGDYSEYLVVSYPAKLNKLDAVPEWFLESCLEILSIKEMLALAELVNGLVILPLYLYDHSGITMNTAGFSCPWDSGQVGWIYVEKEEILRCFNKRRLTSELINQAENLLIAEVKLYDSFICGDVYDYLLEKDGEESDSCYGLVCSYTELPPLIEDYMPEECKGITANLDIPVFA